MRPRPSALALLLCVGLACGDDGSGRDSDTGASGSPSSPSGVSITTPTGSGSDTDVTDGTAGTAGTEGESDSGATASSSDPSDPTLTTSSSDPTLTSDPTVTTTDTTGEPCMGGEQGELESFLWIANSGEDTVSKIDTKSGVELGRYRTRPEAGGSPSRTSVNTAGAVAVANRLGGVAAFHAQTSHCKETNGVPGIQTSSGPGDVRPWGEDECLIWYAPFSYNDNRPVAWTSGYLNLDTCEVEDRNVWTAGSNTALGTAEVVLIDGESGSVLQTIPIPELPEAWPGWFGFYGGAVDADNNFWATQLQGGKLLRVSHDDFSYQLFDVPGPEGGYGMTITADGFVWLTGRATHRFDPLTKQWASQPLLNGEEVHTGGCMGDGGSILYRGSYAQIHGIDTQTLQVVKTFDVGEGGDDHIWGVAVDFEGYVWGVPRNGSRAYKIDPATGQKVLTVEGLVSAYTYSDMTGFALHSIIPE